MTLSKIFFSSIAAFLLVSCGDTATEKTTDNIDLNSELQELTQQMETATEPVVDNSEAWKEHFDLLIPAPMLQMEGLNPDAELQYGYVEQIITPAGDKEVYENYLVVVRQLKSEIEGYPVDLELDVSTYRNDVVETFGDGLTNFTLITSEAEIVDINGHAAIKDEMSAEIETVNGNVKLYYQLAVIEGEDAFYQVLTWCVDEQREIFRVDMESILNSFKEKK